MMRLIICNVDRFCALACLIAIGMTPISSIGAGCEFAKSDAEVPIRECAEREQLDNLRTRKREKAVISDVAARAINVPAPFVRSGEFSSPHLHVHRLLHHFNRLGSPLLT